MKRLNALIADLPYEQLVLVWPIKDVKLWGVLTIDGGRKDYFLAESVESIQPHETVSEEVDSYQLMGMCYPACKAIAQGFNALVISVTDSSELYEIKYLPQGWPEAAHA